MKFFLREGWLVGQYWLEPGTVIDWSADDQWSKLCKGRDRPVTATALDQECADAMFRLHHFDYVRVADGLRRRAELYQPNRTNPAVPE